ncbi:MAG: chemotaxis protein CheY [Pedosphaera sp.]|nr:chemotaxis protein CheY [Pedosphaera sp.]
MKQLKILLVDDNPEFLGVAAGFLSEHPMVRIAGLADSGTEALRIANEVSPDLVLMDLSMPTMNGLETTRRMKVQFPALRIIMVTLYEGVELSFSAKSAGADGFVTKSEFGEALLPMIVRLFPQHQIEPANECA